MFARLMAPLLGVAITLSACPTNASAQAVQNSPQVSSTDQVKTASETESPASDSNATGSKSTDARSLSWNAPAEQDSPPASTARKAVFELDRSIILECADLARFRLRFHMQANRTGFWRSWIYPIEQQTGTSLSFANTLTDLSQRARGLHDPDKISSTSVKGGLACAITGQTITATSSSIELLHNGYVAWRAAQNGFSPGKSETFVRHSIEKIDRLLAERESVLSANPDLPNLKSLQLQGRLLKHIRNQLLYSFKNFSARSREQAWSENTFYAIDTAQALLQFSASCMSLKGYTDRKYVGLAAVTNIVANSMVTSNPIIRTAVGRYIAHRQLKHLERVFPQTKPRTMKQLKEKWQDFADVFPEDPRMAFDTSDATIRELAFLCMQSQVVDQSLKRETNEINRLHRVADQQAIAGPIIGLFSLARSTCSTVSYFQYPDDRVRANQISFAGRISQACGQTYSLIATPRAKIKSVLYQRKLAREGKLPSQINAQSMKRWDEIETAVKAAKLN